MSVNIILVRHAESEGNVAHLINDDPSQVVNLTERGRAQAQFAAGSFRRLNIRYAYASEFPRAQQTAEILLGPRACRINIDARLNERRSGMNGLPVREFNDLVASDPLHIRPAHGESFLEEMERVRSFLDEMADLYPRETVLAVSHENPILAAMALNIGDPARIADFARWNIANCAWTEFVWPVH